MGLPREIVLVTSDFPPGKGGMQRMTEQMAHAAVEAGIRVSVIAPSNADDAAYDRGAPFSVFRYRRSSRIGTIIAIAGMTRRALRASAVQRLVAITWNPPGIALALLRRLGMTVPFTILAHGTEIATQDNCLRNFVLRAVLTDCGVVANSRYTAALLRERGVAVTRVVNPGVNLVVEHAKAPSSIPTILTVGRLIRRKGVDR